MARLYTKGRRYYAEFYDRARRPKKKYVPLGRNKRAAIAALARLEVEFAQGVFDPWNPQPNPLDISSVEEAIRAFLATKEGFSPKTLKMYSYVLGLFRESLPARIHLVTVRPKHIRDFLFKRDLNDVGRETYFRHIKIFFRWCLTERLIERNPANEVDIPKPPKVFPHFLKPKELDYLLQCIRRDAEASCWGGSIVACGGNPCGRVHWSTCR